MALDLWPKLCCLSLWALVTSHLLRSWTEGSPHLQCWWDSVIFTFRTGWSRASWLPSVAESCSLSFSATFYHFKVIAQFLQPASMLLCLHFNLINWFCWGWQDAWYPLWLTLIVERSDPFILIHHHFSSSSPFPTPMWIFKPLLRGYSTLFMILHPLLY